MKKELEVALFAVTAVIVMTLTGCKSTSAIKSPFASKPDPHIASPAEMDDLQLKAPPESYTKDDPKPARKRPIPWLSKGSIKLPAPTSGRQPPRPTARTNRMNRFVWR